MNTLTLNPRKNAPTVAHRRKIRGGEVIRTGAGASPATVYVFSLRGRLMDIHKIGGATLGHVVIRAELVTYEDGTQLLVVKTATRTLRSRKVIEVTNTDRLAALDYFAPVALSAWSKEAERALDGADGVYM